LQGFKAQVTREPTNIVVKIPTPPPAQEQAQQPHQYTAVNPLPFVIIQYIFVCRTAERSSFNLALNLQHQISYLSSNIFPFN
jgi:hypothetical protein